MAELVSRAVTSRGWGGKGRRKRTKETEKQTLINRQVRVSSTFLLYRRITIVQNKNLYFQIVKERINVENNKNANSLSWSLLNTDMFLTLHITLQIWTSIMSTKIIYRTKYCLHVSLLRKRTNIKRKRLYPSVHP